LKFKGFAQPIQAEKPEKIHNSPITLREEMSPRELMDPDEDLMYSA
jgi:hypothetical protein